MATRIWFITGAASGFGRLMTELALSKGEIVMATDQLPGTLSELEAQYPKEKLLVRKVDVRNPVDVSSAFAVAKHTFGRLDVVFNNAGIMLAGELESIPMTAGRNLFDVNFWGAMEVNLEAVKFFRAINPPGVGGRLLISSSMHGVAAGPGGALYTGVKHALEGASESLAQEIDPEWKIKVTMIETGFFRTAIVETAEFFPLHEAYKKESLPSQHARKLLSDADFLAATGDPEKAVREMYKVTLLDNPPLRLPLGKDAVKHIKASLKKKLDELNTFESWSEDLTFEQEGA